MVHPIVDLGHYFPNRVVLSTHVVHHKNVPINLDKTFTMYVFTKHYRKMKLGGVYRKRCIYGTGITFMKVSMINMPKTLCDTKVTLSYQQKKTHSNFLYRHFPSVNNCQWQHTHNL